MLTLSGHINDLLVTLTITRPRCSDQMALALGINYVKWRPLRLLACYKRLSRCFQIPASMLRTLRLSAKSALVEAYLETVCNENKYVYHAVQEDSHIRQIGSHKTRWRLSSLVPSIDRLVYGSAAAGKLEAGRSIDL